MLSYAYVRCSSAEEFFVIHFIQKTLPFRIKIALSISAEIQVLNFEITTVI